MSLEKAIEANTAAIIALTAAIAAAAGNKTGPAPAAAPAAAKPAAEKPAEQTVREAKTGPLDYEKDVKPLALKVAADLKREGLLGILGKFGAANAQALKPEQYADFVKACNEALKK